MIKTRHLLCALMTGCLAVLSGCSNVPTAPSAIAKTPSPPASASNVADVSPIKPTLVDILWKMATTEKEALPEKILPYFGITEIPPVKMYGAEYGWFSIPHQLPLIADVPLQNLGVKSLEYHYNLLQLPRRERDRFSLQLNDDTYCTTADQVIAVFGRTFKRLPARIYTGGGPVKPQAATATTTSGLLIEKGSLHFESGLFEDRGSVTFQFDSAPCAELVSINYIRKTK